MGNTCHSKLFEALHACLPMQLAHGTCCCHAWSNESSPCHSFASASLSAAPMFYHCTLKDITGLERLCIKDILGLLWLRVQSARSSKGYLGQPSESTFPTYLLFTHTLLEGFLASSPCQSYWASQWQATLQVKNRLLMCSLPCQPS